MFDNKYIVKLFDAAPNYIYEDHDEKGNFIGCEIGAYKKYAKTFNNYAEAQSYAKKYFNLSLKDIIIIKGE